MLCLSASETAVVHDAMLFPFIRTVQARHWPSPQPYLAPVNCNSSRRTSSNGRCGSVITVRDFPFTVKVMVASIKTPGRFHNGLREETGGFKVYHIARFGGA